MKDNALKKGLGFGISSAVIATLAIIVGLHNEGILKTISLHIMLAIIVISASHAIGLLIGNKYS
jgi:hypothetical protein